MDMSVDPVITLNTSTDNTNCTAAPDGNGSISLTIDGVMTPAAGYTYIWYEGRFTTGTVLPAAQTPVPGHTAIDLTGGFYTVEVTNTTSNCPTVETFNIMDNPPIISITTIATTPDTNCNVDDGTAEVTTLSLGVPGDYTYEWLKSDGMTPVDGTPGTAATIGVALDGGPSGGIGIDYFVRATHRTNFCTSSLVKFTITNTATDPVIRAMTITPNRQCGAPFDGAIIIEIDGITPPTPATDYMINWVDVASGAVVPPAMITMDGLVISGVPSGNYRVEVTDINDVNANAGCTASATFFVPDTPPIISLETIATTPDTNCNVDDGTAVVTALSLDTPTDYTYEWLDSDGTTLIAGAGTVATIGAALDGGPPGGIGVDYFVRATHSYQLLYFVSC